MSQAKDNENIERSLSDATDKQSIQSELTEELKSIELNSEESTELPRPKARSYDPFDIEEGPLSVGDRVILKEKYLGTCRYVGPIAEQTISDEVFVGVELDDDLTKYSGVFGSRQYFECAFGHGIMVPLKKCRKIKDYSKKHKDTKKKSKSISHVSRSKTNEKPISRKTMDNSKIMPQGTMEILDDYKTYQEKERDVMKTYYPVPNYYSDIDQIYDNMALDYNNRDDCPYPDWDKMRQSFAKIVDPRRPSAVSQIFRSYSSSIDDTFGNRQSSFGSFDSVSNYWPTGVSYDDVSFSKSSNSSSRRSSNVPKSRRSRDVITVRKLQNALASDLSSDSSGVGSFDIEKDEASEPILQSYVALRRNICDDCAKCTKCAPSEFIPIDDVEKIRNIEFLPINTCPDEALKPRRKSTSKKSSDKTKIESRRSSQHRPSVPTLTQQWRAKHGNLEPGMTRGLNKLMCALNS